MGGHLGEVQVQALSLDLLEASDRQKQVAVQRHGMRGWVGNWWALEQPGKAEGQATGDVGEESWGREQAGVAGQQEVGIQ